jgi:hypothetical protein
VTTAVVALQTWDQITADFALNWFIYLSMPFVAAFVGYTTKLVALQMPYRPGKASFRAAPARPRR